MTALENLTEALIDHERGLCGHHEPAAIITTISDEEMRLRMLTLGAILDVFPIPDRWEVIAGLADHWLMDVSDVAYRHVKEMPVAFRSVGIKGPRHNARQWWQVCRGVMSRAKGSVRDLLRLSNDDALAMQRYVRESKAMFPILAGPVISARWLDLIHRVGRVPLTNWELLTVLLSTRQRESAAEFGDSRTQVHPSLALSLERWASACQQLDSSQCGLAQCPQRSLNA